MAKNVFQNCLKHHLYSLSLGGLAWSPLNSNVSLGKISKKTNKQILIPMSHLEKWFSECLSLL